MREFWYTISYHSLEFHTVGSSLDRHGGTILVDSLSHSDHHTNCLELAAVSIMFHRGQMACTATITARSYANMDLFSYTI